MTTKLCGVYKIICTVTDKCYVGSSKHIHFRWNEHKQQLRSNSHSNPKLQHAWNKYGEQAFVFEIIRKCKNEELAIRLEDKFIHQLDSYKNGYNCMSTATMWNSVEVKKRVSEVTKARHAAGLYLEHNRRNVANGLCHNTVQRKKASEHLKQLHRDGKVHTVKMRRLSSMRMKQMHEDGILNTPKQRAEQALRTKKMNEAGIMNNRKQREKASKRMKLLNANPEHQRKAAIAKTRKVLQHVGV